jgi:hypothetical protein
MVRQSSVQTGYTTGRSLTPRRSAMALWLRHRNTLSIGIATLVLAAAALMSGLLPPAFGGNAGLQSGSPVVLNGAYGCSWSEPITTDPNGEPVAGPTQLVDSITMSTAGMVLPVTFSAGGPGVGFGGVGPIFGGGRAPLQVPYVSGFGTGHGFTAATIEDCQRFAAAVVAQVRAEGCLASDPWTNNPYSYYATVAFNFTCDKTSTTTLGTVSTLNKTVLALRPPSAP